MCITPDVDKAVQSFKRELAGYAFVDSYNKMFARYGLKDEFAEVRRLWQLGKRDEAPGAISDANATKIAAFGSARHGTRIYRTLPRRGRDPSGGVSDRTGGDLHARLHRDDARARRRIEASTLYRPL